jgi:hypothetical protein
MALFEVGVNDSGFEGALERALTKAKLQAALFGQGQAVRIGRFEVLRCIGRGSLGVVYEARDHGYQGRVALKLLSGIDNRAGSLLKREFRALSGIVHPNLVTLYELFVEEGCWFVSMELIDGVALDRWVRGDEQSGFDEFRLRIALGQLTAAVRAIHRTGKLHRDLKPSNILVTPAQRVVVLDFGLVVEQATNEAERHAALESIGTPGYVAPEQAAGARGGPASDWYSVGATLFEAITGRLPFEGNALRVLFDKQLHEVTDISALAPGISPELAALCSGLLRRDPRERLDGAAIDRWLGQATVHELSAIVERPRLARLVGREAELEQLSAELALTHEGAGAAVWVSGVPGIGKTALLDGFCTQLRETTLVLRGQCHEQESIPHKVFDAVADALSEVLCRLPREQVSRLVPDRTAALLQLFPVLGRSPVLAAAADKTPPVASDERDTRARGFEALKQLLSRLAQLRPLAVVIDDLQWGDFDSAQMLGQVFGPPNAPGLLFLGAYRRDEANSSAFLIEAVGQRDGVAVWPVTILELGPLSSSSALELAAELLQHEAIQPTFELSNALAHETGGVPFLITELVQHMKRPQGSRIQHFASTGAADLNDVIRDRVRELPHDSRRILEVLCVSGRPLERHVALHAADVSSDDRTAVGILSAARLARARGERPCEMLAPYHDCVREAVVQGLAPAALKAIHVRMVAALDGSGIADPERLFLHCHAAGDMQRAAVNATLAAHAAVRKLAFNRAAELFRHAIALLGDAAAHDQQLHRALGNALAHAGRSAEAADAYMVAASAGTGSTARELRRLAARQYLRGGRVDAGIALAIRALEEVGVRVPRGRFSGAAEFLWQRGLLHCRGFGVATSGRPCSATELERLDTMGDLFPELVYVDNLLAAQLQARFLRNAMAAGDLARTLHGIVWEVYISAWSKGSSGGRHVRRMSSLAERLADRVDTPYARAMLQVARAAELMYIDGRFVDAQQVAMQAQRDLQEYCPGTTWEREIALSLRLVCFEFTGEWQALQTITGERLQDAHDRDDRFAMLLLLLSVPCSHLMRDEPGAALEFLERQRDRLGPGYTTFRYLWLVRSVEMLGYMGRAVEAVALMRSEWRKMRQSRFGRSPFISEGFHYFLTRCLLGAYAQTRNRIYRRMAADVIRRYGNRETVYGLFQRGFRWALHADDGSIADALVVLDEAAEELTARQCAAGGVYFRRQGSELRGDTAAVASIDADLRAHGIANPGRWARFCVGAGPEA